MNELLKAIGEVQAEIPVLPMDGVNPYYRSKYTTLGKILEIVMPIIHKHGIVVVQQVIGENGQVGVEQTVCHPESGDAITSKLTIPIVGDNTAQESGKIITYLRRYMLVTTFGIYGDEDIDANTKQQHTSKSQKAKEADFMEKYMKPLYEEAQHLGIAIDPLDTDMDKETARVFYKELQARVKQAIIDNHLIPLMRQADEMGIELEPLPPDPSLDSVKMLYKAVKQKVDKVK